MNALKTRMYPFRIHGKPRLLRRESAPCTAISGVEQKIFQCEQNENTNKINTVQIYARLRHDIVCIDFFNDFKPLPLFYYSLLEVVVINRGDIYKAWMGCGVLFISLVYSLAGFRVHACKWPKFMISKGNRGTSGLCAAHTGCLLFEIIDFLSRAFSEPPEPPEPPDPPEAKNH